MAAHLASTEPKARSAVELPSPPTDEEKYWYFGPQHRWLPIYQALSFASIAYSMARFATTAWWVSGLLFPVVLYSLTLGVSLLSGGRQRRYSMADHKRRVSTWWAPTFPSIDVFLPSAGEPLDIIANTFQHVSKLNWPGVLRVCVLDDSARPEVRQMAREYGFNYMTRPNRGHLKKAGNLKFGYDATSGDYIFVLDADFVPRPDALWQLVPYMDDPNVGIVQSPQFFDTDLSMGWLQRCAGATQELFYRWIQPSRDRSNAAICVGTCALYRRAALQRSGGFAQIGHSEDVHTGVNLLKVGFVVRYVPILVTKGLCPDTVSGFLSQQYRWCTGSMSLMLDKAFHKAQHIVARQRLCFASGFLYYISTGVNAFLAPLPGLAMAAVRPDAVKPQNSVWLLGAVVLWLFILPTVMRGRWRLEVLRVQVLYSFAHAVAIFDIATGRTKEWVATGAANTRSTPLAETIGRVAKTYIAIVYLGLWAILLVRTTQYGLSNYWAMLAIAGVSAYVYVPILFVQTAPDAKPALSTAPLTPVRRSAAPATVPLAVLETTR